MDFNRKLKKNKGTLRTKLLKKNIKKVVNKTKKNLKKNAQSISNTINNAVKYMTKEKKQRTRRHRTLKAKKHNLTKLKKTVKRSIRNIRKKMIKMKKNTLSKIHLNGGGCDEYAYVNEPGFDIPDMDGVKGLSIAPSKASIGKVTSCPKVEHAGVMA
jgi:hypothetical protein